MSTLKRIQATDRPIANIRVRERNRRIALSAATGIAAKGVAILTTLVSIPLTIGYLGTERYGLWLVMSSFISLLSFTDFGLGNGVVNVISEANGKDDQNTAIRAVSSAFFMLCGVALILACLFISMYVFVPWDRLYNVSSPIAIAEAGPATAIMFACFLINIPLGIVQRVQSGYQEGFTTSIWACIGNVVALVGLLICVNLDAGLPTLVLAITGAPVITSLINGAVLFGVKRPWLRPRLSKVNSGTAKSLFKTGLLFFMLQIAATISWTSDNIVVAQVLGAEIVPQYAVPFKLFSLQWIIQSIVLSPLWPAYGEAIARGEVHWVKTTLIRSVKLSVALTSVISTILVFTGPYIIRVWVGPDIIPSLSLSVGLGLWMIIAGAGIPVAMFLNAAKIVKFQIITSSLMAASSLGLSIVLAHVLGVAGIIWATVISYTIFAGIPLLIYVPKVLKKMQGRNGLR